MRVGCIRVTHPCGTLGIVLLQRLPFTLHVLGLPLAFILSQDQTLHSIIFSFELIALRLRLLFCHPCEQPKISALFHLSLALSDPFVLPIISRQSIFFKEFDSEQNLYRSYSGSAVNSISSMNVRLKLLRPSGLYMSKQTPKSSLRLPLSVKRERKGRPKNSKSNIPK